MAGLALVGSATAAGAAPTHTLETFTCNGREITFPTAGRNGWIDGVKYHADRFEVQGVATAPDGTTEVISDTKVWGPRNQPSTIVCTADLNESGDEGTFVGSLIIYISLPGPG